MWIIDFITGIIQTVSTQLNALSGGNHFLAAAIFGVIAVFLRNTPKQLFNWIKHRLIFRIRITDSYQAGAPDTLKELLKWHQASKFGSWGRSVQIRDGGESINDRIITGGGTHFFFLEGVLFWMVLSFDMKGGDQITREVQTLSIGTMFWNRNKVVALLDVINPDNYNQPMMYSQVGDNIDSVWLKPVGRVSPLYGHQKQFIPQNQYDAIDQVFDRFMNDKDYYRINGLEYKETFMFYGEPGSGKTNLARHFSSKYKIPMITAIPDSVAYLQSILQNRKDPVIVLIEEIDSCESLCMVDEVDASTRVLRQSLGYVKAVRSRFLNFLNGVNPLNNVIVIMTTNHIEKLYSSVYRSGRVDHLCEIQHPTLEQLDILLEWDCSDPRYIALHENSLKSYSASVINRLQLSKNAEDVTKAIDQGKHYFDIEEASGIKYFKRDTDKVT